MITLRTSTHDKAAHTTQGVNYIGIGWLDLMILGQDVYFIICGPQLLRYLAQNNEAAIALTMMYDSSILSVNVVLGKGLSLMAHTPTIRLVARLTGPLHYPELYGGINRVYHRFEAESLSIGGSNHPNIIISCPEQEHTFKEMDFGVYVNLTAKLPLTSLEDQLWAIHEVMT